MSANHGSLLRRPALTIAVPALATLVALTWLAGLYNPAPVAADDDTF